LYNPLQKWQVKSILVNYGTGLREEKRVISRDIDMNVFEQKGKHALHAVIVPVPAQGHVNALINLAQLLAVRDIFVTFVNTDWIHKRMVEASKESTSGVLSDNPEFEQQGRKIRFLSIPDGLPPEHGRTSNIGELLVALQKLGPLLEDLLRTADEKSPSCPPITFIVTDAFMSCTEQVASNMGVPRVIFWPLCAAISISQLYSNLLVSEGFIPVNGMLLHCPSISNIDSLNVTRTCFCLRGILLLNQYVCSFLQSSFIS
jgi:hypothetical protein